MVMMTSAKIWFIQGLMMRRSTMIYVYLEVFQHLRNNGRYFKLLDPNEVFQHLHNNSRYFELLDPNEVFQHPRNNSRYFKLLDPFPTGKDSQQRRG